MMFLGLRKLGNICYGHKMFLNKIINIFCVPATKFVSATNVARAGKRGNICVSNNVSTTMCPRLPGLLYIQWVAYKYAICEEFSWGPRKNKGFGNRLQCGVYFVRKKIDFPRKQCISFPSVEFKCHAACQEYLENIQSS